MPFPDYETSQFDRDLYDRLHDYMCTQWPGAKSLMNCVRYVVDNYIPGALLECGVYRGGTAELIIRMLQRLGQRREVWMFDTFAGMPKPTEDEVEFGVGPAIELWLRLQAEGKPWMDADFAEVEDRILSTGYPEDLIYFRKGMVEDTLPDRHLGRLALVRLDTAYYASTKHELEHLYPLLSPGGIVIVDAYGAFSGCRKATDEYRAEHEITIPLEMIDSRICLWQKA